MHLNRKPTLLLVDDLAENIDILGAALGEDYHLRVALDGEKALALARSARPDLILLDVMMPGMDGYQVCQALKRDPQTQHIPVIFVTALGTVGDEEHGLNLGAIDFLVKPVSPPIIRARVRNHLNLKLKTDLLESLALLDGLTNIPNRRHFNEAAETEWRRAQRAQTPLGLIMADIDFFKDYNDHHGHGAGDDCLRRVAATLADEGIFRPGDLVARYGGEEFIALLPDTDAAGTALLANRFRDAIEALHLSHGHSSVSPWVTVSVGFASEVPQGENSLLALIETADRHLYQAKAAGRNRAQG